MASDFIQLPADSTGKKLASDTWAQGGNTVHGQNVVLYAPDGTSLLTSGGRVKTDSAPNSIAATTGTLTANGQSVSAALPDTEVAEAHFDFSGTFSGTSTIAFEVSYDGGTNWRTVQSNFENSANSNLGGTYTGNVYGLGVQTIAITCFGATNVRATVSSFQAGNSINVRVQPTRQSSLSRQIQFAQVSGSVGAGAAPTGPPVYVGGADQGSIRPLNLSTKGASPSGTPYAAVVHQWKDFGRNTRTFFRRPTITTNSEVMATLTQYYSGAAVAGTATPAVVPAGKTLRIENVTLSYMGVASAGGAVITLRANTSGTAAIGSPQVTEWFMGAAAGAGNTTQEDIVFPDGLEFAAGTGIGFGVQGFTAAMAAAATGYVGIHVTAYEY